jgi:hypothetical protein
MIDLRTITIVSSFAILLSSGAMISCNSATSKSNSTHEAASITDEQLLDTIQYRPSSISGMGQSLFPEWPGSDSIWTTIIPRMTSTLLQQGEADLD